ncbi:hypothetical protein J2129_000659 [Methanofollis sp. W23]|nr:hypothetical protein [Methanofollis sp. W23]
MKRSLVFHRLPHAHARDGTPSAGGECFGFLEESTSVRGDVRSKSVLGYAPVKSGMNPWFTHTRLNIPCHRVLGRGRSVVILLGQGTSQKSCIVPPPPLLSPWEVRGCPPTPGGKIEPGRQNPDNAEGRCLSHLHIIFNEILRVQIPIITWRDNRKDHFHGNPLPFSVFGRPTPRYRETSRGLFHLLVLSRLPTLVSPGPKG